jgi:hypothetical protein
MHEPWNMGQAFTRVQDHIKEADAADPVTEIVLSHDISPWQSEHFFAVTNDVPDEEMTKLSGDYIARVFEGPYRRVINFNHNMQVAAKVMGKVAKDVFFFHDLPKMHQGLWRKLYCTHRPSLIKRGLARS